MLCIKPINILGLNAYIKLTAAVQNVAPKSNFRRWLVSNVLTED